MKRYSIAHWKEHFETSETTKLKSMRWVPVPNKHDGLGFRRLAAHPRAVQLFAAWNLILQVASRGDERGVLKRGGQPLAAEDLALMTGFPAEIFTLALEELSSKRIGWLICGEDGEQEAQATPISAGTPGESPETPGEPAEAPGKSPAEGIEGRKGKKGGQAPAGAGRSGGSAAPPAPAPPIKFLPLKPGLYRREYEAMLADCDREVEKINQTATSYEEELKPDVVELIAMLEKEGRIQRVEEIKRRNDTWKRGAMKPEATALLSAWKKRRNEIRAAINGVVLGNECCLTSRNGGESAS